MAWEKMRRNHMDVWLRPDAPVWIVLFEAIPGYSTSEHYRAYRAVEKPKPGRMPWTVDNRSLNKDGYATLAAAMAAAEAV